MAIEPRGRNRGTKQKQQAVTCHQFVSDLGLMFMVCGLEGGKGSLFLILQKVELVLLKVMQLYSFFMK